MTVYKSEQCIVCNYGYDDDDNEDEVDEFTRANLKKRHFIDPDGCEVFSICSSCELIFGPDTKENNGKIIQLIKNHHLHSAFLRFTRILKLIAFSGPRVIIVNELKMAIAKLLSLDWFEDLKKSFFSQKDYPLFTDVQKTELIIATELSFKRNKK